MKERQDYIDNIRVFLTILVILHHTAITYGAPGGWYYKEPVEGLVPGLLLTVFVATNQAFFMGLFFFLSSYFIPASLARKGSFAFLIERVKRLGIPIILYCLIISPVTIYLLIKLGYNSPVSFVDYYLHRDDWINIGVLWFTAALLLFTFIYWLIPSSGNAKKTIALKLPGNLSIFFFAFALGVVSFLVRIFFPVGWVLPLAGFQPAHFPQYIALFTLGIVAYRNDWLSSLTRGHGKLWLTVALLLIFLGFPGIYFLKVITNSEIDAFMGGFTIQSFVNSVWEQMLGISLSLAVLAIGKYNWTTQGKLMKELSRSAYNVYIIHPMIVVFISLMIKDVAAPSLLKFLITGSLSILLSFVAGAMLTRMTEKELRRKASR